MTRDELITRTRQLVQEGERLRSQPSLAALQTWLKLSDDLLSVAWGQMDRYHLAWLMVGKPKNVVRGRRMTQGVDQNRVALMIAMLEKRAGMQLLGDDVFVNIAGGLEVDEPAVDLGLVTAIASSFRNQPIDSLTAVFGEVGLTGEVRGAMQAAVRAREAQALGFKRIVMPSSNTSGLEKLLGLRVVGVRSVDEALAELF